MLRDRVGVEVNGSKNVIPAEAWYEVGTATDALAHDVAGAEAAYRRAISLAPFTAKYHQALTCLLIDAGRMEDAVSALELGLDLLLAPDGPDYAVRTHGAIDDSDAWGLCAEAGLHALHHFELDFAGFALHKIPPEEVGRFEGLYRVDRARLELEALLNPNYAANLLVRMLGTPVGNLNALPACRLNPARYAGRKP